MSQTDAAAPTPDVHYYSWTISLRPPPPHESALTALSMTAAEQMFFLGAPLAHVVAYEKLLRIRRLMRPARYAARLTRLAARCSAAA